MHLQERQVQVRRSNYQSISHKQTPGWQTAYFVQLCTNIFPEGFQANVEMMAAALTSSAPREVRVWQHHRKTRSTVMATTHHHCDSYVTPEPASPPALPHHHHPIQTPTAGVYISHLNAICNPRSRRSREAPARGGAERAKNLFVPSHCGLGQHPAETRLWALIISPSCTTTSRWLP